MLRQNILQRNTQEYKHSKIFSLTTVTLTAWLKIPQMWEAVALSKLAYLRGSKVKKPKTGEEVGKKCDTPSSKKLVNQKQVDYKNVSSQFQKT